MTRGLSTSLLTRKADHAGRQGERLAHVLGIYGNEPSSAWLTREVAYFPYITRGTESWNSQLILWGFLNLPLSSEMLRQKR